MSEHRFKGPGYVVTYSGTTAGSTCVNDFFFGAWNDNGNASYNVANLWHAHQICILIVNLRFKV